MRGNPARLIKSYNLRIPTRQVRILQDPTYIPSSFRSKEEAEFFFFFFFRLKQSTLLECGSMRHSTKHGDHDIIVLRLLEKKKSF